METHPLVTFLSDFGQREFYVAAVKGVILEHCPSAQIVDISHQIRSHDLLEGAFTLACAAPCFPRGTIHLVVIDPGVGSQRRAIAASDGKHFYVGPDNGVLSLVYNQTEISRVISIEAEHYYRQPVSNTFHGRDIFAPIVGQMAKGIELGKLGTEITDYVRLSLPALKPVGERSLEAIALHVDKFGNIITNVRPEDLSQRGIGIDHLALRVGKVRVEKHCTFYAEARADEFFSLWGSSGFLEIACARQSAAGRLQIRRGAKVLVEY